MAPSTAKNLEVKIVAMQRMFTDVLKELKQAQKPPTKKSTLSVQMAADLDIYIKTRKPKPNKLTK